MESRSVQAFQPTWMAGRADAVPAKLLVTTAVGSAIWPISIENPASVGKLGAVSQRRYSPGQTNTEKGTRNFTDAASQMKKRTFAPFLRNASVSSAAARAHSVDCQR